MTSARSVPATSAASVDYTHSLPIKRIGAGVLFFNQAGHVLLVQTAYKVGWEIPGGCIERNEALGQAAMRDVAEELGLAVVPGRVLAVDWVPPRDGRTDGLMVVFDGGVLSDEDTAAIALPPEELLDWAWCTPEEVRQRLIPLLARRVAACPPTLFLIDEGAPAVPDRFPPDHDRAGGAPHPAHRPTPPPTGADPATARRPRRLRSVG